MFKTTHKFTLEINLINFLFFKKMLTLTTLPTSIFIYIFLYIYYIYIRVLKYTRSPKYNSGPTKYIWVENISAPSKIGQKENFSSIFSMKPIYYRSNQQIGVFKLHETTRTWYHTYTTHLHYHYNTC